MFQIFFFILYSAERSRPVTICAKLAELHTLSGFFLELVLKPQLNHSSASVACAQHARALRYCSTPRSPDSNRFIQAQESSVSTLDARATGPKRRVMKPRDSPSVAPRGPLDAVYFTIGTESINDNSGVHNHQDDRKTEAVTESTREIRDFVHKDRELRNIFTVREKQATWSGRLFEPSAGLLDVSEARAILGAPLFGFFQLENR